MSIALDIGTHEMRSLRMGANRLIARRCRSVYCVLEDSPAHRSILRDIHIPYAVCEGQLLVFGEEAVRLTQLFRVPCLPLLPEGTLPKNDPPVRQLLGTIVSSLIGEAADEGELCALTLPAEQRLQADPDGTTEFFTHLVQLQGYVPLLQPAPQALVLATLGEAGFSGVGLLFGASASEAAVIHRGREVARCAVPFAGDWIDLRLARSRREILWDAEGHRFLNTQQAREWKESFSGHLAEPANREEQFLADLYRGMIEFLLQEATARFANVLQQMHLTGPQQMVVGGGSARLKGFDRVFSDILQAQPFPARIAGIRFVTDSDFTIARGGLIRAELEADGNSPDNEEILSLSAA